MSDDIISGGLGLRTGSLLTAYFNLVVDVTKLVWIIIDLGFTDHSGKEESRTNHEVITIVYMFAALYMIFYLTLDVVLLVGLHKDNRGKLKAYLLFGRGLLALEFIKLFGFRYIASGGLVMYFRIMQFAFHVFLFVVIKIYYDRQEHERVDANVEMRSTDREN